MKNYLPGYDMISRQNGADDKNDGNDCENDSYDDEGQFHVGCFI
jgi:hypothetical protein